MSNRLLMRSKEDKERIRAMLETDGDRMVYIYSAEWGMYWRPEAAGYTFDTAEAGVHTLRAAFAYTRGCGPEKLIELIPVKELAEEQEV